MIKKSLKLTALAAVLATASQVQAASIIMQGDYIRTAVSDDGTLGFGGNTAPGIQHDPTGSGTFGPDYLTPGAPWEAFVVSSNETGNIANNNTNGGANSDPITMGAMVDLSGGTYDHYVSTSGTYRSSFEIATDYFFNDGDERIGMKTTLTAVSDLTGVTFLRTIDNDVDAGWGGGTFTNNTRGTATIAPEDIATAVGPATGYAIGLYSVAGYTHNTGISSSWSLDPAFYLAGNNNGDGDYTIGIAFDFGTLNAGDSVTFDYYYVMGDRIETIDIPEVSVPVPGTLLMLGLGLGLLTRLGRRS